MDIERINEEYLKLKSELEKTRKEANKLEDDANTLVEDRTILNGEYVKAKRNKDAATEKKVAEEMDKIDDKIEKIRDEASKKKEELGKLKEKIQERINEIKENPEIKEHLDEVMVKKYKRQISKLEKEKKEVTDKKERMIELKKLITEHSVLGNHLKAYMKDVKEAQNEIKKLQNELLSKTHAPSQSRLKEIINILIPAAKQRISDNKNKKVLMDYITKNSLNIKEEDIEELAKHGYIEIGKDGDKRIDLDATIGREIKGLDRKIKGYDKSIQDYTIALDGKGNEKTEKISDTSTILDSTDNVSTGDASKSVPATEDKPKWYQFIKRFKKWNEKRKQKVLPKADEEKEETKTVSKEGNNRSEFANSLKYEIVKDIVKQTQTNDLKEAKKERKTETPEKE